jgi:hypothetical protein
MEGSRRVGRHELDIHPKSNAVVALAVRATALEHSLNHAGKRVLGQPEVDESGAGDLGLGDERIRQLKLGDNALRHLARVGPFKLGQHHGQVGGEIAMAGVPRALQHEIDTRVTRPFSHTGELGPEHFAHSAAFLGDGFSDLGLLSDLVSGLASDFVPSAAGFSPSPAFRGPFPSLP